MTGGISRGYHTRPTRRDWACKVPGCPQEATTWSGYAIAPECPDHWLPMKLKREAA